MVLIMGYQYGQQWAGNVALQFIIFISILKFGLLVFIIFAGGPYAGLMPDLVPKRLYGLASGYAE